MTGPAYHLEDAELVRALAEVNARIPHVLRDWERSLARDLPTFFARRTITWKQRKAARTVLDRVFERLAALHARPDLAAVPQPVYQPPRLVPPPPPAPSPLEVAESLTPQQRRALLALSDGLEHPTGARTADGRVSGPTVRALRLRGLATTWVPAASSHATLAKLTPRGAEVAKALDALALADLEAKERA